jgi:hypothetical protein
MLMYPPLNSFYAYLDSLMRLSATPWLLWTRAVTTSGTPSGPSAPSPAVVQPAPRSLPAVPAPALTASAVVEPAPAPKPRPVRTKRAAAQPATRTRRQGGTARPAQA